MANLKLSKKQDGFFYVADADQFTKVGFSRCIENRIASIGSSIPMSEITLIISYSFPLIGLALRFEGEVKQWLCQNETNTNGEWFIISNKNSFYIWLDNHYKINYKNKCEAIINIESMVNKKEDVASFAVHRQNERNVAKAIHKKTAEFLYDLSRKNSYKFVGGLLGIDGPQVRKLINNVDYFNSFNKFKIKKLTENNIK